MSKTTEKRRDNKGRILLEGEYQKSNGQYEFRYWDKYNTKKSIYSWRLTNSDPLPKGKRECQPLRELEKEILADKHDQIDSYTSKTATLNERFDIYIRSKIRLKPSTKANYIYMYDKYVRKTIGRMIIGDINYSVIQDFYNDLITTKGFKPNSMEVMHTVLNPVFARAELDSIIRINPCLRAMKEIRSSSEWEPKKVTVREALTKEQQMAFVQFFNSHEEYSRWVNILTVLLGTGMRIGECIGLTWHDCDFQNDTISVNHTLIYRQWIDRKCSYQVMMPKTKNGIRTIPMLPEVKRALLAEREYQERVGTANTIIDGMSDWVFTNRYGTVVAPDSVNSAIQRICRDYNEEERATARAAHRKAELLPHITNHTLRHSFCTRLMETGTNLKVIQQIMGHADFSTTMDIYTDVSERFKQRSVEKIHGDMCLG